MKYVLAVICISLVVISCTEKDPVPVEFLEVTSNVRYDHPDYYVFATETNGKFLAMAQLSEGETVKLIGPISGDKVNVTFIAVRRSEELVEIHTYTNVARGASIIDQVPIDDKVITQPEYNGINKVVVKNFTGSLDRGTDLMISNGYGSSFLGEPATLVNGTLTAYYYAFKQPGPIYISSFRNNEPVYARAEGVGMGEVITLDYNTDFKPCEVIVNLGDDLVYRASSQGWLNNYITYYMHDFRDPLTTYPKPNKIGSINGFNTYNMEILQLAPDKVGIFNYWKYGAQISPSFKFPIFSARITDRTPANLTVTADQPYSRCAANYYTPGKEVFFWNVYGDRVEDLRLHAIPDEVKSIFPESNFDNFTFFGLSLWPGTTNTHQKFLNDHFDGKTGPHEELTYELK